MAKRARKYWLMKSEPDAFSYADLEAAPKKTTLWDGVRNYQARNLLRDEFKEGDGVLYYHSNAKPTGVAGLARVVRESYPDPTQFDPANKYHDPKSDPDDPRWLVVDIQAVCELPNFVSLPDLKANPKLEDMMVVQRGARLSVQPVTKAQWGLVLRMGGLSERDF